MGFLLSWPSAILRVMPTAKPKPPALLLEQAMVHISDLVPTEGNPRVHDDAGLDESVKAHDGQYKPIVVNKGTHTGVKNQILAGHGTVEALNRKGVEWVQVSYVDVADDKAKRILLVDNRLSDKAEYDDRMLLEMLLSLEGQGEDLGGTGYDPGDLDELMVQVEKETPTDTDDDGDPDEDEPGWKPKGHTVSYQIVFDNEDQLSEWTAFLKRLKALREEDTIAGRLQGHIREFLEHNGGKGA